VCPILNIGKPPIDLLLYSSTRATGRVQSSRAGSRSERYPNKEGQQLFESTTKKITRGRRLW